MFSKKNLRNLILTKTLMTSVFVIAGYIASTYLAIDTAKLITATNEINIPYIKEYLKDGRIDLFFRLFVTLISGVIGYVFASHHELIEKSNQLSEKYGQVEKLLLSNNTLYVPENKLILAAEIIDFYPEDIYKEEDKNYQESFDILINASYQNLLLTPSYLNYFFYRSAHTKKANRIIVVDIVDHPLIVYCALSILAKYNTYIIYKELFIEMIESLLPNKDMQEILLSNPYMEYDGVNFRGAYSPFIKGMYRKVDIPNEYFEEIWKILKTLEKKCSRINFDQTHEKHLNSIISHNKERLLK